MTAALRPRLTRSWRNVSRAFGASGLALGAWGLFYPRPLVIVAPLLAIAPVIGIAFFITSDGRLNAFDEPRGTFGLASFTLLCPIVLSIIDLLYFPLLVGWRLVGMGAILGLALGAIYLKVRPASLAQPDQSIWQVGAGWLGVVIYGGVVLTTLNGILPQSPPQKFEATVLGKRVSPSRRHTSYYLKLPPLASVDDSQEWDVGQYIYNRLNVGQHVCIYIYPGALGEPWWHAEICKSST